MEQEFIRRSEYREYILPEMSREALYDAVARLPVRESVLPELDRISGARWIIIRRSGSLRIRE